MRLPNPLQNYRDNRYAMLCETVEEAEEFQKLLGEEGYCWRNGDGYLTHPLDSNEVQRHCECSGGVVFYFNCGTWDRLAYFAQTHSMEYLLVYNQCVSNSNQKFALTNEEKNKLWEILEHE